MTTHVFIVDESTFHFHLEHMFAGTGAKTYVPSFITEPEKTPVTDRTEKLLVSMLADCSRVRMNDNVIFYLQAKDGREGRFYGIFKIDSEPFLDLNGEHQYLAKEGLRKVLPYRVRLRPYKVYSKGVTEWTALDDIEQVPTPDKMIWSLIYRKLRGNRGNTMITIYEAKRLLNLIRSENDSHFISGNHFSFDLSNRIIVPGKGAKYTGQEQQINILPRLIYKCTSKKSHEAHLQSYIIGNIEKNLSLLRALGLDAASINWIGNEVSCGVGMQKIDIVISSCVEEDEQTLFIVELKDEHSSEKNFPQIYRYVKWIQQYYCPNTPCIIQPVLISLQPQRRRSKAKLSLIAQAKSSFNSTLPKNCNHIKLIEYSILDKDIIFTNLT